MITANLRLLSLLALICAIFAARFVNERGIQALSQSDKARLLDGFSAQRKYALLPVILLVALMFAFPNADVAAAALPILLIWVIALALFGFSKIRRMQLGTGYLRAYAASQAIQIAALVVVVAIHWG